MSRAKKAIIVVAAIVVIIAASLTYVAFTYQRYVIPSESMTDTLNVDDQVLSERHAYDSSSPQQGDVVTFNAVDGATGETSVLVKRVIAVGGQTVEIKDGTVYVDGSKLDESYTDGRETGELKDSAVTYPYAVPEGYIWVMGDNRINSKDSRYFGAVPVENITGKVVLRYWPITSFGGVE